MTYSTTGSSCAVHTSTRAGFECASCGARLCDDCIDVTKYLILCGICGETAEPLPGVRDPRREPAPTPVFKTFDSGESAAASFLIQLTNHVVVPGALIAMVSALLFFLVDLRSVFLPMGFALKWVGLCYVVATVLIARYGHLSASRERQGLYTVMLGGAMVLVLFMEPWETKSSGPLGIAVNVAIVLAVWHFASRVTTSLSREGEGEPEEGGLKLHGRERLALEAWERDNEDARLQVKRSLHKAARDAKRPHGSDAHGSDAHGNPSAAVARLVAGVLVVIALGEPLILAGPPEVGPWALAAVVVFLFSAALVLAAGSAVGTLRHARRLGGRVAERLVPARVMSAGVLMVVLLAVAMAVPGMTYRGSGQLGPKATTGAPSESGDPGEAEGDVSAEDPTSRQAGDRQDSSTSPDGNTLAAASQILAGLTTLGRYLAIPFMIAVVLGGLYALYRLAPLLAKMKLSGFGGWLARLAAALRGRRKAAGKKRRRGLSAEISLDGLRELPPREAVVTAYARLLPALEAVGHPRETRTPDEVLASLPGHLRPLRGALATLTPIYVRAAYGTEDLGEGEREEAVSALVDIRRLLTKA